jgi:carboxyl-terminal processing protease
MSRRCLFALLLLTAGVTARSAAADPAPATPASPPFARHLWAVTDLVLDHHVDPPARQQMLLTGVKELLARNDKPIPPALGRRVSAVTTPEQFEALLKEVGPDKTKSDSEADAIEGMLTGLPGRAHFFPPAEVKVSNTVAANNYVGIGIQLRNDGKEKLTQIVVPFPGGPFRRAGGKSNDLITEVDGKSMTGVALRDVVTALRGEEGSPVTVTVRQPDSTETRPLKMVREVIPFQSAIGFRRASEENFDFHPDPALPVAYIRLQQLTSSTYHELRRLERQLRPEGYRALVLDLRGTAPGQLVHAAQVADAFLDGGLMFKIRDARGVVKEYKADRDCLFRDWPMVVLTDETTVETAALIAAALQDRGRAVLVGGPSLGGVSVKSLVPLPDGMGGVNLVTGTVERVKKHKQPTIVPDHDVRLEGKRRDELQAWHNRQVSPDASATKAPDDPQLAKALELLRPMLKVAAGL